MKQILINLFGLYVPTGDTFATADWPYILGVLGFFMIVYCVFRLIGIILSK